MISRLNIQIIIRKARVTQSKPKLEPRRDIVRIKVSAHAY